MTPETILAHEPRVLSPVQRQEYFAQGFLVAECLVPGDWLAWSKQGYGSILSAQNAEL
jgi:hypothetical protein